MPMIDHYYVRRPDRRPAGHLPFGVRSTGFTHCVHPHASIDKKMPSLQLFWCTQGAGRLKLRGRDQILKRHQLALLLPGMRHYFHTDGGPWSFYWLTLDGPLAVVIPAAMRLEAAVYDVGPAPVALFRTIQRVIAQPSLQAESQACQAAFAILLRAARLHALPGDAVVKDAVAFMHQQYGAPELNVKTLAALVGVPRAKLSARFQAGMGLPPSAYLERLRVQNALALLQHSRLPVGEIAHQCGLADANYFARLIRRVTGASPSAYRALRQRE